MGGLAWHLGLPFYSGRCGSLIVCGHMYVHACIYTFSLRTQVPSLFFTDVTSQTLTPTLYSLPPSHYHTSSSPPFACTLPVHEVVKLYTADYDRTLIFNKVHHELNQVSAVQSMILANDGIFSLVSSFPDDHHWSNLALVLLSQQLSILNWPMITCGPVYMLVFHGLQYFTGCRTILALGNTILWLVHNETGN